jgi:hypothetical protein
MHAALIPTTSIVPRTDSAQLLLERLTLWSAKADQLRWDGNERGSYLEDPIGFPGITVVSR